MPNAEILEIGGLLVDQRTLRIEKEFEYKIRPKNIKLADPESLRLINYTPESWEDSRPLNEVLEELIPIFKDNIMVGFNIAMDYARLERVFFENGYIFYQRKSDPFYRRRIDVLSIAYAKLKDEPQIKYFSLRELCDYFQIPIKKEHSALEDSRATYKLFLKLLEF